MLRHRWASVAVLVVLLSLAGVAQAVAHIRVVSPTATRMADPCDTSTPCEFYWAVTTSSGGDTVQFESGQYDFDGALHPSDLDVPTGVTIAPAPGDATRPVIKQTVGYTSCNCPTVYVYGTVQDMEIDQSTGVAGRTAGAVGIASGGIVERTKLTGIRNGMYFTGAGQLLDSLVIAGAGTGINSTASGPAPTVSGDTVIAHGSGGGLGTAILVAAASGQPVGLAVTNTIARGDSADVSVQAQTSNATATLHNSDTRVAMDTTTNAGGTPALIDLNPLRSGPVFNADDSEAASSPTIDAGTPSPAAGTLDIAGQPRTVGPAPDIGAFEFQGEAPQATTGAAAGINTSSASVTGTVMPGDLPTTWHVAYGPTSAYGSSTAGVAVTGGLTPQAVSAVLTGLTPGTTYHYAVVATNALGTVAGADQTLMIENPPPGPVPLSLRHVAMTHRTFAVATAPTAIAARRARPPLGTTIFFTPSETVRVRLTITHTRPGRRQGKTCVPAGTARVPKRGRCTIVRTDGSLLRAAEPAASDAVAFSGRIGRRALPPGSYTLTITATDQTRRKVTAALRFTIVKR